MFELLGISPQSLLTQLLIGLINGSFYALLSLGLAVIFGMLNIINFSHGAQYMMGAFVAYFLLQYAGLGYWLALVLAPIIVGVTGVIIERLFLQWLYKLDHLYGLLLTFGLALIIEGVFRNYFGSSGLPYELPQSLKDGHDLGFMYLPNSRAWVVAFSLVVCLATWFVIERTKLGSYLRAATENPTLVRAFGINVSRMITLTYGFGVGLAALAGVMAAPIYNVSPQMGADLIIVVFAVVVIGGMGSIMGSDRDRLRSRRHRRADQGLFSRSLQHRDLRHHGDRLAGPARRPVRAEGLNGARVDPATLATPRKCRLGADRVRRHGGGARHRAVLRLSDVPDAGAVLCAVCLRLQPADRLRRAAVVRPRALFRLGQLSRRPFRQGLGLPAGTCDPNRSRDRRRRWASSRARSRSAGRASISR